MAGMDREGGALFANNRKNSQGAPDYRGELRLNAETLANLNEQIKNGVQFPAIEISGWKKTSNNGTVFISMAGKKPYVKDGQAAQSRPQQQQQRPQQGSYSNDLDDSIPF